MSANKDVQNMAFTDDTISTIKHFVDLTAIGTAVLSVLHWAPEIAALLSAIWTTIRLVEWAKKKFFART